MFYGRFVVGNGFIAVSQSNLVFFGVRATKTERCCTLTIAVKVVGCMAI